MSFSPSTTQNKPAFSVVLAETGIYPEEGISVPDHVLSRFSPYDSLLIDKATEMAAEAVLDILEGKPINEILQKANSFHP